MPDREKRKIFLFNHIKDNVLPKFANGYINNAKIIPATYAQLICINNNLLAEAVLHAVVDIDRMAKLHIPKNSKPDRHKYAAFVSRWIAKIKPIYIIKSNQLELPQPVLRINAAFSVYVFESILKEKIPENLVEHLEYLFHFRDVQGETLGIIAYTSEKISLLEKQYK